MRWPDSDHCQDGRFFTPNVPKQPGFRAVFEWLTHRERTAWPPWIKTPRGAPPPERLAAGELRVTFVNHATVLLQIGELNVITDPIWSDRASPVQFTGPRRHRAPGIRFEDLPPIDVLLLSHNHYDHLDTGTLLRLRRRDTPTVYCPLGVAAQLKRLGFRSIVELDWWQQQAFREVGIHCVPAQHFSARGLFDRNRTLWCGWHIQSANDGILFAGDTGFGPHFAQIAKRFPAPRLALLPIGAYRPRWFMGPVHMGPEEALEAHAILKPQVSIPIHYGTFSLADDGESESVDHLRSLLAERPEQAWRVLPEGEGWTVPTAAMHEVFSSTRD
jgi:L-ascorbate metabolism protein UlaG (beta-lactamase superfamily)